MTTLHFLPLQFQANVPPSTPPNVLAGTQNSSAKRKPAVVVVDDERLIADTLAEILNDNGYRAIAVYDGMTALEQVQKLCPDALITDVVMPGMNGVDVAKAVRRMCAGTRIFLLSGQATTAELIQGAKEEGHSFELLPKPLDPEVLLNKLTE
jgi:DNA-binding response OmpR family regulator